MTVPASRSPHSTTGRTQFRRRILACVGDCQDISAYSGTPYYLLQAARRRGVLEDGLRLSVSSRRWKVRRIAWNLGRVLGGRGVGGYQYSAGFLEALWEQMRDRVPEAVLLNCYQLYPRSVIRDQNLEKWFFVDQTLGQLFRGYGGNVGRSAKLAALEDERTGYHAARGVIANSRWAARSIMQEYGVPPDRVHVVLQGANLDEAAYRRWDLSQGIMPNHPDPERPLRLVFVGRDWRRKGLDRLVRALAAMHRMGSQASLRVIGCNSQQVPSELRAVTRIEWLGAIDKNRETRRFIQALAECDFGCLLSRAEAGGISLREFAALGLSVLGPDVGGAPEQLIGGASIAVDPGTPPSDIAELLYCLERNPDRRQTMRECAWRSRHLALWQASLQTMLNFWPPPL